MWVFQNINDVMDKVLMITGRAVANVLTKKIIRNNFVCLLANLISPSRHSPS